MSGASRPSALRPLGDRLARLFLRAPLPLVAVEVRPRAVCAVRLAREGSRLALGAAAASELPAGVLEVSLTKPNVIEAASFQAALRATLERVGALSGGPVSLVLPDPAVRLALVPAAGLRGRDASEVLRFQLHKALPFDVRGARLAWRAQGEQALVAVAPEEVLSSYEQPLEQLGFQPGLVEPAGLALADAAGAGAGASEGDTLLVNWDEGYVTFILLRAGLPLLIRTLPGESGPDAVARQAVGTLQFHKDRLGGDRLAGVLVRSAGCPGEDALAVLGRALGLEPRLLAPWAALGMAEAGEAAQAVAGAAASVLRRAA